VTDPAISVLLPTLNRRALVTRAVASVLAQTRPDFELLIVDGGSTDGTQAALEPLLGGRVRMLTVPGAGAAAARNTALRRSSGGIIAFLDSDDVWRRQHLAVVSALLERHPEAVLVSTCPRFDLAGRAGLGSARVVDPLPRILVGSDVGFLPCVAVRRADLEAVGGFDERLTVGEDNDLWRRLSLRGPFVFLRRRTVTIQRTTGSLSDRARHRGQFERFELSTSRLLAEVERAGRSELKRPALGAVHYARALSATARKEDRLAATELREAVELLPSLSRDSDRVLLAVRRYFPTRDRLLRALVTLAQAWPDRRAETAAHLRLAGASVALRSGRPRTGLAMLLGMRLAPTVRLVVRLAFGIPYHLRRLLVASVHRGRESPDIRAGVDIAEYQRAGADGR
jgi:hypothetical protein